MGSDDGDPIAEAILSDDPEAGLRYAGWAILGRYSLPTKLRWIGLLMGVTCASVLTIVTVRSGDLASTIGTRPLSASVPGSVVLAAGLKFVTLGTIGLLLVGLERRRNSSTMDEERLFGIEETAALLAFGTGGLGVVVGVGLLVLLAFGNEYPAWMGDLSDTLALPATYGLVVWWSFGVAIVSLVGSTVFEA